MPAFQHQIKAFADPRLDLQRPLAGLGEGEPWIEAKINAVPPAAILDADGAVPAIGRPIEVEQARGSGAAARLLQNFNLS